jgi:hypothetical protein
MPRKTRATQVPPRTASQSSDIDRMELVERFFALGRRVVGMDHPIGIFLAGCRECLAGKCTRRAALKLAPLRKCFGSKRDLTRRLILPTWAKATGDRNATPMPTPPRPIPTTCAGGGAWHSPACGLTDRMGSDPERGAHPRGLTLPGVRMPWSPGRPPDSQALARGLRLRPRSPRDAVPRLS